MSGDVIIVVGQRTGIDPNSFDGQWLEEFFENAFMAGINDALNAAFGDGGPGEGGVEGGDVVPDLIRQADPANRPDVDEDDPTQEDAEEELEVLLEQNEFPDQYLVEYIAASDEYWVENVNEQTAFYAASSLVENGWLSDFGF